MKVLNAFGFNQKICNWIEAIPLSAKLSISVNGKASGYFSCKRGVRQGDPLSLLLFCLTEEVLSRGISKLVNDGKLTLMTGPRGTQVPSHVLYADNVMILCRGTQKNVHSLMNLFQKYDVVSGQVINPSKSTFYSGAVSSRRQAHIADLLGFAVGKLPFIYIGIPIFKAMFGLIEGDGMKWNRT